MSKPFLEQRCMPCEGGISALTETEARKHLEQVPQWQLSDNHDAIQRVFDFKGFYATMSFINMVAWIAQQQGHHPDVQFGYNQCTITFTTHAISGLSDNDFICASLIDNAMLEPSH